MTLPAAPAPTGLQALSLALREGRTSAFELTQAALARIAALEPRLQAFMHLDPARALVHAQAIAGLRNAGVNLGPLMGVPVAVKDLFSVDGMPTTAGTRLDVQDLVPPQGSFVDALLRCFGKGSEQLCIHRTGEKIDGLLILYRRRADLAVSRSADSSAMTTATCPSHILCRVSLI